MFLHIYFPLGVKPRQIKVSGVHSHLHVSVIHLDLQNTRNIYAC